MLGFCSIAASDLSTSFREKPYISYDD
jgi:hypothetical protein